MDKNATPLKPVPSAPQRNSYSCGAAVTQAVAQYFGYWTRQDDVVEELGTSPAKGTSSDAIVAFFKKMGLRVRRQDGMTWEELDDLAKNKDVAVIVNFQAWNAKPKGKDYSDEWEDGHYAILMAINNNNIYLRDPSMIGSIGFLPKEDFLKRWHDQDTKDGKRREFQQMCIIVEGPEKAPPKFKRID
jgi:predicted double-glycine peptidase